MSEERSAARPAKKRGHPPRWVNALLLAATLVTTFFGGALFLSARSWSGAVSNGLQFMAALMGILICHEAGHYIMARRNRVDASLPFFIPVPPFLVPIGTLGALILMRDRIRSRNALMDVGAAGPLAGIAVALPVLLVGLARCPVGPIPEGGWMEGQSLLYMAAKWAAVGPIPEGQDVYLDRSPLAWAGWLGLLVTMINLMPIGQLDGGHISYALLGERHRHASRAFHAALFLMGAGVMGYFGLGAWREGLRGEALVAEALVGLNWIFWGGLLWLLKKRMMRHPPTDDEHLSPGRRATGYLCLALFALTFMPYIMRPI
ncbi:MAG: site-2 protease family protein [Polyangia bacterium]